MKFIVPTTSPEVSKAPSLPPTCRRTVLGQAIEPNRRTRSWWQLFKCIAATLYEFNPLVARLDETLQSLSLVFFTTKKPAGNVYPSCSSHLSSQMMHSLPPIQMSVTRLALWLFDKLH